MLYFSMSLAWSASTGTGNQRINLNLPNSILPIDAVTPSRWACAFSAYGFAFTGSALSLGLSGGVGFIAPFAIDNAGTSTAIPASTASGTYESISGCFRIR